MRDLLTSAQGQAPPRESQLSCPAQAEFVICDCTIELSFRYAKCELALECPRLWSLEARLKLLGMVMLVYAFLLSLLDPLHHELVEALLPSNATAPESAAKRHRHRFTGSVGHSVGSGTIIGPA
ncbi:MAG: hypothetical protein ACJ8AG_21030 [Ktedonobacteraceae bacterium]